MQQEWNELRCWRPDTEPAEGQRVVLAIPGVGEWAYETVNWSSSYWNENGVVATKWREARD